VRSGGETVGQILTRVGPAPLTRPDGTPVGNSSTLIPAGMSLRAPGVRWHHTIARTPSTRWPTKYGVTQAALERANNWTSSARNGPLPGASS